MGSVTVSQVVPETARFPYSTMLATTPHSVHHPTQSPPAPTTTSVQSSSNVTAAARLPLSRPSTTSSNSQSRSQDTAQDTATSIEGAGQHSPQPPQEHLHESQQTDTDQTAAQSCSPSVHTGSAPPSPKRVKVKDLNHIQSFVQDEKSLAGMAATGQITAEQTQELPQYEISGMPVTDVIEMVAGLLTKITTTNDDQAERLHGNIPSSAYVSKVNPLSSSVLAFHGKNVPTISIMSYLARIHKYCPATYEVFLSLLVYFDRITEKINASPTLSARDELPGPASRPSSRASESSLQPSKDHSNAMGVDNTKQQPLNSIHTEQTDPGNSDGSEYPSPPPSEPDPHTLTPNFVVDSFNIHRLIIAGVTCASKFFSDVFYTNSRYAKVNNLVIIFSHVDTNTVIRLGAFHSQSSII